MAPEKFSRLTPLNSGQTGIFQCNRLTPIQNLKSLGLTKSEIDVDAKTTVKGVDISDRDDAASEYLKSELFSCELKKKESVDKQCPLPSSLQTRTADDVTSKNSKNTNTVVTGKSDNALILPHSTLAEAKVNTILNATTVPKPTTEHKSLYMNENVSSQSTPKAKWKPRGRGRGRGVGVVEN